MKLFYRRLYFLTFQRTRVIVHYASRDENGGMQRASSLSHEAEGDRELSSAGMTARGRRPRDVNRAR